MKGLRAQVLEEQEHTMVAQSQLGALKKEVEEERAKMSQERERY